jgi:NhaP-type Na+/H+ or K+/H+ antiporter
VLLVGWTPVLLRRLPLSLAILCVIIGVAAFQWEGLGFNPDPRTYDTVTERLAELVVIISLMGAGLKIDRPLGWRRWSVTWRLLIVAMPVTIAAVAFLGVQMLGFSLAVALLFGAAMAPTDPVLASDVQTGPPKSGEDGEVRFGLTSEAGLNDALAFPFVNLAIVAAAGGLASAGAMAEWAAIDVVWKLAAGGLIGWAAGRLLGWVTFAVLHARLSGTGDGLVALGATFLAYAAAETAHGYGFLAVFICALTFRSRERSHDFHGEMHDFAEQIERLLMMLVLVLFGGALANGLLDSLTWIDVGAALLILFVVRPIAAYAALIGSPHPRRDRALLAFLGIRGIGSVYYVAYGLNHGEFGSSERLWAIAGLVILGSILVHGATSTPLMRWIDRTPA